jgi:hypothetical protein
MISHIGTVLTVINIEIIILISYLFYKKFEGKFEGVPMLLMILGIALLFFTFFYAISSYVFDVPGNLGLTIFVFFSPCLTIGIIFIVVAYIMQYKYHEWKNK